MTMRQATNQQLQMSLGTLLTCLDKLLEDYSSTTPVTFDYGGVPNGFTCQGTYRNELCLTANPLNVPTNIELSGLRALCHAQIDSVHSIEGRETFDFKRNIKSNMATPIWTGTPSRMRGLALTGVNIVNDGMLIILETGYINPEI